MPIPVELNELVSLLTAYLRREFSPMPSELQALADENEANRAHRARLARQEERQEVMFSIYQAMFAEAQRQTAMQERIAIALERMARCLELPTRYQRPEDATE